MIFTAVWGRRLSWIAPERLCAFPGFGIFNLFLMFYAVIFIDTAAAQISSSGPDSNEWRLPSNPDPAVKYNNALMPSDRVACGTSALLVTIRTRTPLGIATDRRSDFYLTRPTQPGEEGRTGGFGHTYTTSPTFYNSPGGHFKIWYVTSGSDRPGAGRSSPTDADNNGIPDWVEQCATYFDHSWRSEIDTLGYRPPPEDFSFHAQYASQGLDDGGDGRYDVYIQDLGSGIAGYTAPEQVISGRKVPSYIVVDNDYAFKPTLNEALDLLKATAAHEFFHAVQFGYDSKEEIFWLEQTATWMEEIVFDEVNDYYTYLNLFSGFLSQPWVALDTQNGQHEFAGVLWPLFLSQRFDRAIIRAMWEAAETVQALDAMEQALQAHNSSLKNAFKEFTVWNVFTGVRANPALYYEEGAAYPQVVSTDTTSVFPVSGPNLPSNSDQFPAHLGANYIRFTPNQFLPGGLRIDFTGLTGEWGVSVVGASITGPDTVMAVTVTSQHGTAVVHDWGRFDTVFLVVASLNRTGFNYQYQYNAVYDSTLTEQTVPTALAMTTFPNPFVFGAHAKSFIRYDIPMSGRVVLKIYNVRGQEVRTLIDSLQPVGQFISSWDGADTNGRRLASGVYFCRLTVTDSAGTQQRLSGKMMIIK